MIHGPERAGPILRPRERIIRAQHNMLRPHDCDEMPESLGRENQGINVNLFQIFRGRFPEWRVLALIRKYRAAMVHAIRIRGQVTATVSATELQAGVALQ